MQLEKIVNVDAQDWEKLARLWINCVKIGGIHKDHYNDYCSHLIKKYCVRLSPEETAQFAPVLVD